MYYPNRKKYSVDKKHKAFFRSFISNTYISTMVFFMPLEEQKNFLQESFFHDFLGKIISTQEESWWLSWFLFDRFIYLFFTIFNILFSSC